MADLLRLLDKTDLDRVGDVAAAVEHLAWTHGITAEPEPIDAFADNVNRLCDQEITFDRTEMLLIKLIRVGVISEEDGVTMHAAHLAQRKLLDDRAMRESDVMREESSALEAASRRAFEMRKVRGEIQTYVVDGWVVRGYPGGRIDRLAPLGEFRAEDHPYPGWTPPAPPGR